MNHLSLVDFLGEIDKINISDITLNTSTNSVLETMRLPTLEITLEKTKTIDNFEIDTTHFYLQITKTQNFSTEHYEFSSSGFKFRIIQ